MAHCVYTPTGPIHARRLKNGNIIVYLSLGKIVLYAPTGLSRFQNPDFFAYARALLHDYTVNYIFLKNDSKSSAKSFPRRAHFSYEIPVQEIEISFKLYFVL